MLIQQIASAMDMAPFSQENTLAEELRSALIEDSGEAARLFRS
jgi:hypothetical protein